MAYHSGSAESAAQVATGPGYVSSLSVKNVSASTRYVYVFDGTSSSGTRIEGPFTLASGAGIALGFSDERTALGMRYTTGLYVGSSSTLATYTAAGGTDLLIDAEAS